MATMSLSLLAQANFLLRWFWGFEALYILFESYYWYYGIVGTNTVWRVVGVAHMLGSLYCMAFFVLYGCRLDLVCGRLLRCPCARRCCSGRCCAFQPLLCLQPAARYAELVIPLSLVMIAWSEMRTLGLVLMWACALLVYFRFHQRREEFSFVASRNVGRIESLAKEGMAKDEVPDQEIAEGKKDFNAEVVGAVTEAMEVTGTPATVEASAADSPSRVWRSDVIEFLIYAPIFTSAVFALKLGNGSLNVIHGTGSKILLSVLAALTFALRFAEARLSEARSMPQETAPSENLVLSTHQALASQSMAVMIATSATLLLYLANPVFMLRYADAYPHAMQLPLSLRLLHFAALVSPSLLGVYFREWLCWSLGFCAASHAADTHDIEGRQSGCREQSENTMPTPVKSAGGLAFALSASSRRRWSIYAASLCVSISLAFLLHLKSSWWRSSCPDWTAACIGVGFTATVGALAAEVVLFVRRTLEFEFISDPKLLKVSQCACGTQELEAKASVTGYVLRTHHVCRAFALMYGLWLAQSLPMLTLQTSLLLASTAFSVYLVRWRGDRTWMGLGRDMVVGGLDLTREFQEAMLSVSALLVLLLLLHVPQWSLYDLTFPAPASIDRMANHDSMGAHFNLTVATWNIQRGFAGTDRSTALNYGSVYSKLSEWGVDVASFQESEASHPFTGATDFGSYLGSAASSGLCAMTPRFGNYSACDFYYGGVLAKQTIFGNAMLAASGIRWKTCDLGRLKSTFPMPTRPYTWCSAELRNKSLAIYSLHLSFTEGARHVRNIANDVQATLASGAFDIVIVMGDFNVRISDSERIYQPFWDVGMVHVLNPFGLPNFEYPGTRTPVPGRRVLDVDHIFVFGHRRVVEARAREELWKDELSDHIPVVATIEF